VTALILICSLANTPDLRDCSRTNAIDVIVMPVSFGNAATCFMHGQANSPRLTSAATWSKTSASKWCACARRPPIPATRRWRRGRRRACR